MDANVTEFKQRLPIQTKTKWETVAESRWGNYISQAERRALLMATDRVQKPGAFLEVGCEGGRWSQLVSDLGWQATCTDINADALRVCQNRLPSARCVLVTPENRNLPCDSASLSMVICIEVIAVITSDWFLKETVRVLEKDGMLVGAFLNKHSIRGYLHHLASSARGGFDFYRASYQDWKRQANDAGLEVIHEEGLCWLPFRRDSNSPLVPLGVWLERSLRLHSLPDISPWIVFIAKKR